MLQTKNKQPQSTTTQYWIYGKHPILAAIQNPRRKIYKILCTEENVDIITKNKPQCPMQVVKESEIDRILKSNLITHQGIIANTEHLTQPTIHDLLTRIKHPCLIVALDQITDPHNIGAIIRSAAAFDVSAILITKNASPKENATIVKVASGGFEKIPFMQVINLSQTINILKNKGFWVFGLDEKAQNDIQICKYTKYDKTLFVLGSEESGIRSLVKKSCDMLLKIPIEKCKELGSLNVSAAGAIAMYSYFAQIK